MVRLARRCASVTVSASKVRRNCTRCVPAKNVAEKAKKAETMAKVEDVWNVSQDCSKKSNRNVNMPERYTAFFHSCKNSNFQMKKNVAVFLFWLKT